MHRLAYWPGVRTRENEESHWFSVQDLPSYEPFLGPLPSAQTEAAAVDAGGESLCSGCSKDEVGMQTLQPSLPVASLKPSKERHTLMSRQMEDGLGQRA